ncbi:hypothetical protein NMY22_g19611 [Coprinellus aureogranulatus]|nr:hypothetical protein NMY22_g19611 [Coprinellus aureogranulatus]
MKPSNDWLCEGISGERFPLPIAYALPANRTRKGTGKSEGITTFPPRSPFPAIASTNIDRPLIYKTDVGFMTLPPRSALQTSACIFLKTSNCNPVIGDIFECMKALVGFAHADWKLAGNPTRFCFFCKGEIAVDLGRAFASIASKAPAKPAEDAKAAKKTSKRAALNGDEQKRKKVLKETYSSYIYNGQSICLLHGSACSDVHPDISISKKSVHHDTGIPNKAITALDSPPKVALTGSSIESRSDSASFANAMGTVYLGGSEMHPFYLYKIISRTESVTIGYRDTDIGFPPPPPPRHPQSLLKAQRQQRRLPGLSTWHSTKERWKKDHKEAYSSYINIVLKQVYPNIDISNKATAILNSFVNNIRVNYLQDFQRKPTLIDSGIANEAVASLLRSFVNDIFERIAAEASTELTAYSKKSTISAGEIQIAVHLVPGELAKHTISEDTSSVTVSS